MPGFFLRQTLLAGLIVINLLLLIFSIDWLLFEPIAAFLFLLLLILALLAIAVTGLSVTAGSRYTLPYRAVMGYLLWAPNRASRFSAHCFGLLLLLTTRWLTVPRAIFRVEANCQSAPAVSVAGFLGRIVRIPCAEQRATVRIYQPFRTLDAPAFVGSSLSRDSDQQPVEVDPHGQWADVFLSVMSAAGRDAVSLQLTNPSQQTARFSAPVQATALR